MIQSCSWSERVASSLDVLQGQERSTLCTFCNLTPSADELGGISSRMWGAAEPELAGIIDSKFKWNSSANGKSRTLRKARTFTRDNRKKSEANEMRDNEGLSENNMKNKGDLLVSESEKLGVNILGQRFGINPESFPIKKRFSLRMSHLPLYLSSSSDLSDLNDGVHAALLHNHLESIDEQKSHFCNVDLASDKSSLCTKRRFDGIGKQQTVSTVDFSGISILADAAIVERELMDFEGQPVGEQSTGQIPLVSMNFEPQRGEGMPSCNPDHGNDNAKSLVVSSALFEVLERLSGESKSDECELGDSTGSLLSSPSKTKMLSTHDGRLNWDLNRDSNGWESLPVEIFVSKLNDTTSPNKAGLHESEENGNPVPGSCEAAFAIDKVGMVVKDKYDPSYDCMSEGARDREHAISAVECHEGKNGVPHSQMQDDGQYVDAILIGPIAAKETLVCVSKVVSDTKMVEVDFSNQEKYKTNGIKTNVEAHTHKTVSPVIDGNAGVIRTIDASGPCAQGKKITETLHAKGELITRTDSFSDDSVQCPPDHVEVGAHNNLSPRAETHVSFSSDVALSITVPQSPACQMHQDMCGKMFYGANEEAFCVSANGSKSKSMACEACVSDETICSGELNSCADANQSKCPHLSPQKNSDDDQLPCTTAFIIKHEKNSPDVKVDDSKCSILSDGSLGAEKSASPVHICPDLTCSDSEGMLQSIKGMPSMVDSLSSKGVGSTFADGHLRSPGQVSLDDFFCSEYHSDASPVDADPITGLEMVEFIGDNHSQYEDGELRESICNSWGEDGAEEVDAEHVDYGSDYRETEFFEAEPTSILQNDLIFGNLECKQEGHFLPSDADEKLLPFPEVDLHSKHFLKCLPMPSVSDGGSGKAVGVDMLQTFRKDVDALNIGENFSRGKKRLLEPEVAVDVGKVSAKSSQPACSRLKSSGWDKLPGVDDSAATFHRNHGYASFLPSVSRKFTKGASITSVRRNSSSRIESKFSEESCRKEISYARQRRKREQLDLDAEGINDARRSLGRCQLSFRLHGRGRGDCWVDSRDHHGNVCYDKSCYRTSSSYASRNATAAAVAKVESSGFVVASDGTIVKVGSMTPGSHVSRSSKSSIHLHSRRSPVESSGAFDMSPDRRCDVGWGRSSRCVSGMSNWAHRSRFHGPMEANRIDSAVQHPLSRREQSFSPHRRPVHLSREFTRSSSRSRTRSPCAWSSSIRRSGVWINGSSNVSQQSRSPNLKKERRLFKQNSLQLQTVSADLAGYARLSRNHSSPKFASSWIDDKNLHDQLREHKDKRPSGRCVPSRVFSQSSRLIDSSDRMKLDDFYQRTHSGSFHVNAGYGRGFRLDASDDGRRVKINKYEMLHPDGHFRK